jgi:hypothetical protein
MTREASRRLRQAIDTAQSILARGGTAADAAAAAQRYGAPADGAASSGDSDGALSEAGEPCELYDAAAQLCIGGRAATEAQIGAGGGEVTWVRGSSRRMMDLLEHPLNSGASILLSTHPH